MPTYGRYTTTKKLTSSENAAVYLASDGSDPVVLKVMRNGSEKFGRELQMHQAAMTVNPRNLVRLKGTFVDGVWGVLVIEAFAGNLLDEPMNPARLLNSALDSVRGLCELRRAQMTTDDMKPQNIVVSDNSGRCALCDFGGVRYLHDPPAEMTDEYAAPELLLGQSSPTTAIFSWGLTFERVCTGMTDRTSYGVNIANVVPWVGRDFGQLLIDCCISDPLMRPDPETLLMRLKMIAVAADNNRTADGIPIIPGGVPFVYA